MADAVILAGEAWVGLGAVVAVPFLLLGVGRADPASRKSWLFRPLLLPGCVLFWPVVLAWWVRR
jgi:hypothetical protein